MKKTRLFAFQLNEFVRFAILTQLLFTCISPSSTSSLTWETDTAYPFAVLNPIGLIGKDHYIYVFGGANSSGYIMTDSYKYNISVGSQREWIEIKPMPKGLDVATGCLGNDGRFFIFGRSDSDVIYIYNATEDSWNNSSPNMPSGASINDAYMSCAVDSNSGLMYLSGGYNDGTRFYSYNASSNAITNLLDSSSKNPFNLYGQGSFVANDGKLYVFGGKINGKDYFSSLTYIYDIASKNWTNGSNMTEGAYWFGYATDGNRFYAIGGLGNGGYIEYTQVYDIQSGIWGNDDGIVYSGGVNGNSAVFLDGSLHSIGGGNTVDCFSMHEIALLCGVYAFSGPCDDTDQCILNGTCESNGKCTGTCISFAGCECGSKASSRLSAGAIAGIVIGVLIFVVMVGAAASVFLLKYKGKLRFKQSERSSPGNFIEISSLPSNRTEEIGKYTKIESIQMLESIGGGNFGEVYHGKWNGTTDVALKQLKANEHFKEFIQEAAMLQSLNHPNIVRFFGIHTTPNGAHFLVMEYMRKGSLDKVLRAEKKQIFLADLLSMTKDAASGMVYLHQQGIVHRDLALRNLLVSHSGKPGTKYAVKISDFGMARTMDKGYYKTESKTIPVRWCSPEAIQIGKFSFYSDVWSFGVVMWEIFSYGTIPYYGIPNERVIEKVTNEGYVLPLPKNCSKEIYQWMLNCWNQEPEQRPSFDILYDQIERKWEEVIQNQTRKGKPLPNPKSNPKPKPILSSPPNQPPSPPPNQPPSPPPKRLPSPPPNQPLSSPPNQPPSPPPNQPLSSPPKRPPNPPPNQPLSSPSQRPLSSPPNQPPSPPPYPKRKPINNP